jgi:hypothetical protein
MRILEPDKLETACREIQIIIDVPERYVEMVEIHRTSKNGPVIVQVTSAKVVEPKDDCKQYLNPPGRNIS